MVPNLSLECIQSKSKVNFYELYPKIQVGLIFICLKCYFLFQAAKRECDKVIDKNGPPPKGTEILLNTYRQLKLPTTGTLLLRRFLIGWIFWNCRTVEQSYISNWDGFFLKFLNKFCFSAFEICIKYFPVILCKQNLLISFQIKAAKNFSCYSSGWLYLW